MDTILRGWLAKSPQERPWTLLGLKPKWRRRYFVLCGSQASTALPGQCPAILHYYDNEKQTKKKGSIDLNSCEEVLTRLNTPLYEHVFSLRSKHKDHHRTYILAADTEDDMNRWVQCLCTVLQLNDESGLSGLALESSAGAATAMAEDRYVRVMTQIPAAASSQPVMSSLSTIMPPVTMSGSQRPSYATSATRTDDDKFEEYIQLGDCYSGLQAKQTSLLHTQERAEEIKAPVEQTNIDYFNVEKNEDEKEESDKQFLDLLSCQTVSHVSLGGINFSITTNDHHKLGNNTEQKLTRISTSTSSSYVSARSASCSSSTSGVVSNLDKDIDLPSYINLDSPVPLSPSAQSNRQVHGYVNAPSVLVHSQPQMASQAEKRGCHENSMKKSGANLVTSSSFAANNSSKCPQKESGVTLIGKGEKVFASEPEVVMTGRTRSFKRPVANRNDVALPMKKTGLVEVSSSSDDVSDDEMLVHIRMEDTWEPPLPPKAPPRKDVIQYLDLNLPEASTAEKSGGLSQSAVHLVLNETNYNEIDWVKTKALIETKNELETERETQQREGQ